MRLKSSRSRWVGLVLTAMIASAAGLVGCGGGGGGGEDKSTQDDSANGLSVSFNPVLTGPYDNQRYVICGQEVAPNYLSGTVLSVHDGDTITVSANPSAQIIRLEGIDAPELAQSFGVESRDSLKAALLGKTVGVAHRLNYQNGRVIGSVFTEDCLYANLDQLNKGLAWFYRVYQCELNMSQRTLFQEAEQRASQAHHGLWSQADPVPPWYFRNGTNPTTPTCSSDWPKWSANTGMSGADLAPSTGGTSTAHAVCGTKNSCSQMISCAEAQAYYSQCSVHSLDGDGDGTPCEALCKP